MQRLAVIALFVVSGKAQSNGHADSNQRLFEFTDVIDWGVFHENKNFPQGRRMSPLEKLDSESNNTQRACLFHLRHAMRESFVEYVREVWVTVR